MHATSNDHSGYIYDFGNFIKISVYDKEIKLFKSITVGKKFFEWVERQGIDIRSLPLISAERLEKIKLMYDLAGGRC
jgi:hypothetical protein